jgi:hypothetical protein
MPIFRRTNCILSQHLVSSLSLNGCTVRQMRAEPETSLLHVYRFNIALVRELVVLVVYILVFCTLMCVPSSWHVVGKPYRKNSTERPRDSVSNATKIK